MSEPTRSTSVTGAPDVSLGAGAIARGRLPFVSPEIACSYAVPPAGEPWSFWFCRSYLVSPYTTPPWVRGGRRVLGRLSECRGGNECDGERAQDGDDAAGHVTS